MVVNRRLKVIDKGHVIDADDSNPVACPLRHDSGGRDNPCTSWCAWFSVGQVDGVDGVVQCRDTVVGQMAEGQ